MFSGWGTLTTSRASQKLGVKSPTDPITLFQRDNQKPTAGPQKPTAGPQAIPRQRQLWKDSRLKTPAGKGCNRGVFQFGVLKQP